VSTAMPLPTSSPWPATSVPSATPVTPTPVATPAFEAPATPRVGEGALQFSHSGQRFVLGFGADFFGIWDRTTPGGPVSRYVRTDEGWNQAWNQFVTWEPRAVVVAEATPPPDVRWSPPTFRSGHGLGVATSALLALMVVLIAISLIFRLHEVALLHRIQQGGFVSRQDVNASDARLNTMLVLRLFAAAATVVVWLVWQHRSQANLPSLGAQGLKYTPGWAVGWWFIPFANFAMPYLTVRELRLASDPQAGALDWKARRAPALVAVWWAACLASIVLASLGSGASFSDNPSIGQLIVQDRWGIASNLILLAAAILAVMLVRAINALQAAKWTAVSSSLASTAPAAGAPAPI
jgi:hypothetical protein